tara:strand:- start:71 stop:532 length:462 start_codon:yes stop_codon:yes gene_type:complete
MKEKKRVDIVLTSMVIILAIFLFFLSYERECNSDEVCFSNAAKTCRSAKLTLTEDTNTFTYEIQGLNNHSCIIEVTAVSIQGTQETISEFQGKNMICIIPKSNLTEHKISELNIIDYCTGELKEEMYELVIERLYGSIAENLGHILLEISKET